MVSQKYTPLNPGEWSKDLQAQAAQLCARINAMNWNDISAVLQEKDNPEDNGDTYPLETSLKDWRLLHKRFPDIIDASLLKSMYDNFHPLQAHYEKLPIPMNLCHSDFHPENFLTDGHNLIICDWQEIKIGRGIDDIAFFVSRVFLLASLINILLTSKPSYTATQGDSQAVYH
jgi:thiamine kinase-like enzyme